MLIIINGNVMMIKMHKYSILIQFNNFYVFSKLFCIGNIDKNLN